MRSVFSARPVTGKLPSDLISGLPDGPRGRALALALTAALAAALWLGVLAPLMSWYADRADLLVRRTVLATRMTELVETLPALQARLAASASNGPPAVAVLQGGSDAIASAALQGLVQDMARAAGISLTRIETLPAEARGSYRRIALRVALSTPLPDLVTFLVAAEQANPRMLVDDLQLRSGVALVLDGGDGSPAQPIDAALTVLAFRPEPASGK